MKVVWDEPKRLSNLVDHKLDFGTAELGFDWAYAVYVPSYPGRRGEPRVVAVGHLGLRLVTLVFSPLGSEAISLVSMRTASRSERRLYARSSIARP